MKRFAYPLVILAACLPFQAQAAGDNPSPALLAKIQLATQADSQREFKDMKKFVNENAERLAPQSHQSHGVGANMVSSKKVGGLDVSKWRSDISQRIQVQLNEPNNPPPLIGKAIGGYANDGEQD